MATPIYDLFWLKQAEIIAKTKAQLNMINNEIDLGKNKYEKQI